MKYVHPFPARMAPEIAIREVANLDKEGTVLDPMMGSGMVLLHAAKSGVASIGIDMDPLACLIAKVGATKISPRAVRRAAAQIMESCDEAGEAWQRLEWVDGDEETSRFVKFWFAEGQERQLRVLAHSLHESKLDSSIRKFLQVALSRLIITKEAKASLARDTAHSRPHKVSASSDYDIYRGFLESVEYMLHVVEANCLLRNTTVFRGDARKLSRLRSDSVDLIVTSPPYFNAIDYLRGHRMSLVWLGFRMSELRAIRGEMIGSERSGGADDQQLPTLRQYGSMLPPRGYQLIKRYYRDLTAQLKESFRVLKPGGSATYVIGNSRIREVVIRNHELLKNAANLAGFTLRSVVSRTIPESKRYLPVQVEAGNTLGTRMKKEYIIRIEKPQP